MENELSNVSIWVGIASPLVVAAVTWGGMRAELRHLHERVKQLEVTVTQVLREAVTRD